MMRSALLLAAAWSSLALVAQATGPFTGLPWGQGIWSGSTADHGRGGAGLALQDSTRIQELNPALFHAGRTTRFQIAFSGNQSRVSDGTLEETLSSGSFDSWSLAFPLLWQGLSSGVRLRPLTRMDFLSATSTLDELGHEYTVSRKGSGGLSEASLVFSGGLPQVEGLRAGLEFGLVFGSVLQEWKLFYPETAPPYDTWINYRQSLFGFQPRLGLAWNRGPLNLGLTYAPRISADLTIDIENLSNNTDQELSTSSTSLPGELAFGVAWQLGEWLLAADLRIQDWSDTDLGLGSGVNATRNDKPLGTAFGIELPLSREYDIPWYRRFSWRGGLRMQESYADWSPAAGNQEALESMTLSAGAGIPLRSFGTWLDLAVEWELRGDAGTMGLDEQTFRIRAGLSARDIWFLRPTY